MSALLIVDFTQVKALAHFCETTKASSNKLLKVQLKEPQTIGINLLVLFTSKPRRYGN